MASDDDPIRPDERQVRARNVRTGLVMLSIALVFFLAVIVNRFLAE